MNNFNFLNNEKEKRLYIIISGLSGGKDEGLVKDLSSALIKSGSILNIQFCNDPLYKEEMLEEVDKLTFEYCFKRLDREIKYATKNHKRNFNEIIFVGHSFSALISIYYLYRNFKKKKNMLYKLTLLDKSSSVDILKFMKTDQKDITLSNRLIKYLEGNNEIKMLGELKNNGVKIKNIESSELDANHEFEGKKVRKTVSGMIKNL